MNRIYKLVKNRRTGQSVAVSEQAKGNKKSVSGQLLALTVGLVISSGAVAGGNLTVDDSNINSLTFDIIANGVSSNVWTPGINIPYYGNVGSVVGYSNNQLMLNFINNSTNLPNRYFAVFAENPLSAVSNNTLLVENAQLSSSTTHLFAASSLSDTSNSDIFSNNNKLIIHNGSIGNGGFVNLYGSTSFSIQGSSYAKNNEVQIDDGLFNVAMIVGAESIGGYNSLAQGNTVNINGGTYTRSAMTIVGGVSDVRSVNYNGNRVIPSIANMTATGNSININGGDFSSMSLLYLLGGQSTSQSIATEQNIQVSNNTININQINSVPTRLFIAGGYVRYLIQTGTITNPIDFNTNIYGNEVNIDDVAINSRTLTVYGGIVDTTPSTNGNIVGGGNVNININNNTINLVNNGNLNVSTGDFYGGFISSSITAPEVTITQDVISNNTLNLINNTTGTITIKSAQNFENYHFYLGADIVDGDVLLSSTNAIDLDYLSPADGTTVKDVNVAVKEIAMGSGLKTGDTVVLMDNVTNSNGSTSYQNGVVSQGQAQQGLGSLYDITVKLNGGGNQLEATIGEGQATEQSKALFEGNIAGLAFVNQGADLVSGQGIQNALQASGGEVDSVGFGAMGGGKSRYQTGSHVDVRGLSLMTGFAKSVDKLMLGGFIEAGWGNYDSYNSFNSQNVDGDGSTNYYGVGALAHYQLNDNVYLDGSLRVGWMDTDFSSNDFLSGGGSTLSADYKTKSTYLGAQLGGGYVVSLSERQTIAFSANYLWTYQGSDDVKLKTGDKVSFDSANSHRLRVGGRYFYESGKAIQPYLGAAYEYEFGGKGKGSINGFRLQDNPELKGGTGIFELGTLSGAIAGTGFSVDMNIKGYVGTREGVSGQLNVRYGF